MIDHFLHYSPQVLRTVSPPVTLLPDGVTLDAHALLQGDFDPVQALSEHFEQAFPSGLSTDEEDADLEAELELDVDTFELRPVFKLPKEDWEGEVDKESAAGKTLNVPGTSSDKEDHFAEPKLRNRKFSFKPFKRETDGKLSHDESGVSVDVIIPEQLAASYGLYLWPSSPVLGWYLWLHQDRIKGKTVLELGAGTALPGLLCGKVGARKVFLADAATDKGVLNHCRHAVGLNGLADTVVVLGRSVR